jgi:hypothetical protein
MTRNNIFAVVFFAELEGISIDIFAGKFWDNFEILYHTWDHLMLQTWILTFGILADCYQVDVGVGGLDTGDASTRSDISIQF